jgi:hypothetical protein
MGAVAAGFGVVEVAAGFVFAVATLVVGGWPAVAPAVHKMRHFGSFACNASRPAAVTCVKCNCKLLS